MDFSHSGALIIFSSIVLISYLFNLFSQISRIPSVLLLIGFGIFLRSISGYLNLEILNINHYLDFLGTIGLILIVLEGAADLKIKRQNFPIIKGSFFAALGILLVTTTVIETLFYLCLKADMRSAFVNAIPLGVISSAIAIPTVANFAKHKKEFLTYEAIFSDILGIMFFNFMVTQTGFNRSTFANFIAQLCVIIVLSIVGTFLLFVTLHKLKNQAKFFILLSLLVLIYSVGKIFNLSSLLLVFTFGILLNNQKIISVLNISKHINQDELDKDIEQLKLIVSESAFLVRTFFFVVFGYSMNIMDVFNLDVLKIGIPVVLILFWVRFIYLKYIVKFNVFPEIFIAPKGLVTILLFYSIPQSLAIKSLSEGGVVLFVILATGLLMLASGSSHKRLKIIKPDTVIC